MAIINFEQSKAYNGGAIILVLLRDPCRKNKNSQTRLRHQSDCSVLLLPGMCRSIVVFSVLYRESNPIKQDSRECDVSYPSSYELGPFFLKLPTILCIQYKPDSHCFQFIYSAFPGLLSVLMS